LTISFVLFTNEDTFAYPTHQKPHQQEQDPIDNNMKNNTNRITACDHHHRPRYTMGRGIQQGFQEIVMRSPGRYEIAIHDKSGIRPPRNHGYGTSGLALFTLVLYRTNINNKKYFVEQSSLY